MAGGRPLPRREDLEDALRRRRVGSLAVEETERAVDQTARQPELSVGHDDAELADIFRGIEEHSQEHVTALDIAERRTSFDEIDPGYDKETARQEALRCMSCGCTAAVGCDVRRFATEYGADPTRFLGARRRYDRDDSHPEVVYEPGKCILCDACVRIAEEAGETLGVALVGRGFQVAMGVPFDTEGTPKGHLDLVVDGVTKGVAHNRKTAKKSGVDSTGNNITGSESWGPIPTNVFVGGSDQSVDELIAGVERGIYVSAFNYCRILDPKTMVVTGLTRNGTFMIENGRINDAVTNMRFTQSFVDALGEGRILGLGDDARFADSEFAPGIMYVPTMCLGSWNFTGGAEG